MIFSYGYVDESGQTGLSKKSSKYLILACILFKDSLTARRLAKDIFTKFRLGDKSKDQVHTTHEDDRLKIKFLSKIKKEYFKVVYVAVRKKKEGVDYYFEALELLLEKLKKESLVTCYISKLYTNKNLIEKVNRLVVESGVKTEFDFPTKEKGLQVADFIAWCIYQKYEFGRNEFYEILYQK